MLLCSNVSLLMNRELSAKERYFVLEALRQEPDLSDAKRLHFLSQVDSLRVIEECDCGDPSCYSVRFSNSEIGYSLGFADGIVYEGTKEEMRIILFLHSESELISEMETVK